MPDFATKEDVRKLQADIEDLKRAVATLPSSVLDAIRKELPKDTKPEIETLHRDMTTQFAEVGVSILEVLTRLDTTQANISIDVDDFRPAGGM